MSALRLATLATVLILLDGAAYAQCLQWMCNGPPGSQICTCIQQAPQQTYSAPAPYISPLIFAPMPPPSGPPPLYPMPRLN